MTIGVSTEVDVPELSLIFEDPATDVVEVLLFSADGTLELGDLVVTVVLACSWSTPPRVVGGVVCEAGVTCEGVMVTGGGIGGCTGASVGS